MTIALGRGTKIQALYLYAADFGAPRQRLARCLVQKNHPWPCMHAYQNLIPVIEGRARGACRIMKTGLGPVFIGTDITALALYAGIQKFGASHQGARQGAHVPDQKIGLGQCSGCRKNDPGSLCRQTKIFVPREMEQGKEGGACRIMKNPSWPGIQGD